jgi:hypothetical protein
MRTFKTVLFSFVFSFLSAQQTTTLNTKDDGFRGIWYFIGKTNNEYVHKYSGGLGTYPANHYPFAIYSKEAHKTFFCYGGASTDSIPNLLHEVSYFDHKTKMVSRPTIILDKKTNEKELNDLLQKNIFQKIRGSGERHQVDPSNNFGDEAKQQLMRDFEKIGFVAEVSPKKEKESNFKSSFSMELDCM